MLGEFINKDIEERGYTTTVFMLELFTQLLFYTLCLFLIWVTQHGNSTIGFRHALFTFYLMKDGETLFDSFMANIAINNIVSLASIQYSSLIFYQWTKNSLVLRDAMFNKWSVMNLNVKGYRIFDCVFILFFIASLINIALRGSGRIRYGDAILDKEARKKSQA